MYEHAIQTTEKARPDSLLHLRLPMELTLTPTQFVNVGCTHDAISSKSETHPNIALHDGRSNDICLRTAMILLTIQI